MLFGNSASSVANIFHITQFTAPVHALFLVNVIQIEWAYGL